MKPALVSTSAAPAAAAAALKMGREPSSPAFEETFADAPTVPHKLDVHFDDLLVAYFELGGRLTALEIRRLRVFGYGCDPKERLAELRAGQ